MLLLFLFQLWHCILVATVFLFAMSLLCCFAAVVGNLSYASQFGGDPELPLLHE